MEGISQSVAKSVWRELQQLHRERIEGISFRVNEDNLSIIEAEIIGPDNTPYEGGCFTVRLCLDSNYPSSPPKGFFLTKLFHPNVSIKGEICVNTLKKDWQSDCGLKHVFLVIRCLLIEPNPESALNMDAGHLLLENYEEFYKRAKLFTQLYAIKDSSKENLPSVGESNPIGSPKMTNTNSVNVLSSKNENGTVSGGSPKKKLEKKKSLKRL
eukprot:NODE_7257_length_795_cov_59.992560_g6648_i0.p1 GENE.NODE_7257_length_795_cov_59.992560_g6648_i0~~NODE_7257_length_795_cov_59.992560_g6648_i0.p1  ORF type:complete len:212 (-),score=14.83 NODE_7257_length_795_cov_59.992560_g6648_i0:94-729(-)